MAAGYTKAVQRGGLSGAPSPQGFHRYPGKTHFQMGKPERKRLEAESELNKEGTLGGSERKGSENREEVVDRKPMLLSSNSKI